MNFRYFREIDRLGRVVVPMDIRKSLAINAGDVLDIQADDSQIVLKKAIKTCVFCGTEEELTEFSGKHICRSCLEKLSEKQITTE